MLLQNDPFRDIDAWFDRMTGRSASNGQWPMPMDAYKRGNDLWVDIDLPGVDADWVEINVERNVFTVSAQRTGSATRATRCTSPNDIEAASAARFTSATVWMPSASRPATATECSPCASLSPQRRSRGRSP